MSSQTIPIWKEAPFLRVVFPLMLGIALQWYLQPLLIVDWCIFGVSCLLFLLTGWLKPYLKFKRFWLRGFILQCSLLGMGLLLTSYTDYSDQSRCVSRLYKAGNGIIASLEEPLAEKPKSYKAEMAVQFIFRDNKWQSAKGSILVYLQKDKLTELYSSLHYGDWIIFNKILSPITNTGNPGAFDRQWYCKVQHIYFQVYLSKNEFVRLPAQSKNRMMEFFFVMREKIVSILRRFLRGDEETGLAEALLIGYKDDLDKSLVQAYSNTGTTHIIAISGLHLALIYGLLKICLGLIGRRSTTLIRPFVIIVCLWGFSILSGASASVLRSAVMFSCITIGDTLSKKSSIYNTLSASAFFLLCYNPFWLWDLGFQLSYAAVLSIVIFMKPIYHLIYIQSKIPDLLWKSIALTLSAQILTLPICIYQFHQFPNYFLLTNLLAVPLSSIILLGELLVCAIAFAPVAAGLVAFIVSWMIAGLNGFIKYMGHLPFSVWSGLQINWIQVILMYLVIAGIAFGLMQKSKRGILFGLLAVFCFLLMRIHAFIVASRQERLIVYNIPGAQGIDCIRGRRSLFRGDSMLCCNNALFNFYLKPARIKYRVAAAEPMASLDHVGGLFKWRSKRILIVDDPDVQVLSPVKIAFDLIVLSKNTRVVLQNLAAAFDCRQWVFDASNRQGSIKRWKQECEKLGLPYYSVVDKGAFVMTAD